MFPTCKSIGRLNKQCKNISISDDLCEYHHNILDNSKQLIISDLKKFIKRNTMLSESYITNLDTHKLEIILTSIQMNISILLSQISTDSLLLVLQSIKIVLCAKHFIYIIKRYYKTKSLLHTLK